MERTHWTNLGVLLGVQVILFLVSFLSRFCGRPMFSWSVWWLDDHYPIAIKGLWIVFVLVVTWHFFYRPHRM